MISASSASVMIAHQVGSLTAQKTANAAGKGA